MVKVLALVAVLAICLTGTARAEPESFHDYLNRVTKAKEKESRERARRAMAELQKKAEKGDARAQFELAQRHLKRKGYREAAHWLDRAAAQKYVPAQLYYGEMLERGLGVKSDPAAAAHWFYEAAKAGNAEGQAQFAHRLMQGRGVKKDPALAATWYTKAGNQGHIEAISNLAAMYVKGLGVKKDEAKAFGMYRLIAKQNVDARRRLGWMRQNGIGTTKNLDHAAQWYRWAAVDGNTEAQYQLAKMLAGGYRYPKKSPWNNDKDRAEMFYRAAKSGHAEASYRLALMYATGDVVKKDAATAVTYLRAAALKGHDRAQLDLAIAYYEGFGVKFDAVEAIKWYTVATQYQVTGWSYAGIEEHRLLTDKSTNKEAELRAKRCWESQYKDCR